MTENAAKKLEIQNRANIEIEKLRNKSEEEQKKRDRYHSSNNSNRTFGVYFAR